VLDKQASFRAPTPEEQYQHSIDTKSKKEYTSFDRVITAVELYLRQKYPDVSNGLIRILRNRLLLFIGCVCDPSECAITKLNCGFFVKVKKKDDGRATITNLDLNHKCRSQGGMKSMKEAGSWKDGRERITKVSVNMNNSIVLQSHQRVEKRTKMKSGAGRDLAQSVRNENKIIIHPRQASKVLAAKSIHSPSKPYSQLSVHDDSNGLSG
jgi:hypothetical protein